MQTDLVQGIERAYTEWTNPIVFALTGRTGSGCTTAAKTLSTPFSEIALSEEDFEHFERRKMAIARDYLCVNWVPFTTITVSSVIHSYLLEASAKGFDAFLAQQGVAEKSREELVDHLSTMMSDPSCYVFLKAVRHDCTAQEKAAAWEFFAKKLVPVAAQVRKELGAQYPGLFQTFGDNIRVSGNPLDHSVRPECLFSLMDRVRRLVDCSVAYRQASGESRTRVVIDAIRNPLELVYLRKHIVGLYVVAITADNDERRSRLMDGVLAKKDVDALDDREYEHTDRKPLDSYSAFVTQNLKDCIQKSDIFVANPGRPGQLVSQVRLMNAQLVRYVALALRPGLVTPTRDERCMQIAFVAKLNSGCISRQVGAVVADPSYSIHALGWNDTPKGQTPCLLRDVGALLSGNDAEAFSEYEKTDSGLRKHLEKNFRQREELRQTAGLRCPFCFKDAYNSVVGEHNQVHTRSLHAEENAFLQLAKRGGSGIQGGVLYTTASPCELCSKKAFQLGIHEVVYVDPYPGISVSQVLRSGPEKVRPKLRLFNGAVGHAYHRLYESLLPIKDEYRSRLMNLSDAPAEALDDTRGDPNLTLWS